VSLDTAGQFAVASDLPTMLPTAALASAWGNAEPSQGRQDGLDRLSAKGYGAQPRHGRPRASQRPAIAILVEIEDVGLEINAILHQSLRTAGCSSRASCFQDECVPVERAPIRRQSLIMLKL
jgi:hypothetical protein